MLRELKPGDTARFLVLLKNNFPEEEALMGTRPEGVTRIVRRVFRWDTRLFLGLLRLLGQSFFRFYVIEADHEIVATTLLSFSAKSGYVSMVVVDPARRRQGLARRLLEQARVATVRRGRRFIALDVLEANAPARTLYESLGYRTLRAKAMFAHESPDAFAPLPTPPPGVRAFRRQDAPALVELARKAAPPRVNEVLPLQAREIASSEWANRLMLSQSAAWVVDRGHGPEAYVGATTSPLTEAANLSSPIIGETVDPETAVALIRTAAGWLAPRKPTRILSVVTEDNTRGRAVLEAAGFRSALPLLTLYRESA
ncbi:MAG TPA: GNAT family N-acetyltransferase [Thermoplasmata archaeon]|nr:GNAT family N-acetyltransferase [Thermoplasmata archaeon]